MRSNAQVLEVDLFYCKALLLQSLALKMGISSMAKKRQATYKKQPALFVF